MDHIHKLKHTMAVLEEQIELLRIQATGMKGTAYDKERVQGGNISTDDRMLSLIEAEEKYQRTVMEYHEAVLVRTQQIAEMEDPEHAQLLLLRYVVGSKKMSLEDIAEQMHKSLDRIKHLHLEALAEFERMYMQKMHNKKGNCT